MNTELSQPIQADLDRFSAAWKSNDGAVLGAHYVEDGSLVNPFGQLAVGRGPVSAMYTEYFGTVLKGTSTVIRLGSVRPLGTDQAFTDSEQVIYADDGSVVMSVHLAALLRREGGSWRFVDARPYTPSPTPS